MLIWTNQFTGLENPDEAVISCLRDGAEKMLKKCKKCPHHGGIEPNNITKVAYQIICRLAIIEKESPIFKRTDPMLEDPGAASPSRYLKADMKIWL